MVDKDLRQCEKFEADYEKIASKDMWSKEDITMMKDLQKLMYYLEVRDAMKNGGSYPSSEYIESRSYRGPRPRYSDDWSMPHHDMYGMSGRRYYDDAKEETIRKLRHMMDTENDPSIKMAIQHAVSEIEAR